MSRRAGVTLTELLVSVAVIVTLAALTLIVFSSAQRFADKLEGQVAQVSAAHAKKHPPLLPPVGPQPVPNQYVVTFKPSVTNPQAEAKRLSGAVPAQVLHVYNTALKGASVRIQPGDLGSLKADPAVARVEQDLYRFLTVLPTGVSRIQYIHAPVPPQLKLLLPTPQAFIPATATGGPRNLPAGTGLAIGNSLVTKAVAIIDSGIDNTHPDLNVVFSQGFGQPDGTDQNGHGTHVAGIVGARGIVVTGVFPNVPLWSLRVADSAGKIAVSDSIAAIDFVAQNAQQIGVANMSYGGTFVQAEADAVDACSGAGVVMCAAAGNSSADAATLSPAAAPTAICVAALADSDGLAGGKGPACSTGDADDTFAKSFSCFGNVVAVIAPGVDIYSTIPVSMGSYGLKTGTSMSTPHTSGMSALTLTLTVGPFPSGNNAVSPRNIPGGSSGAVGIIGTPLFTTPAQVKASLIQNAVEHITGPGSGTKTTRTYPLITGR
jgi:subtilisin family serine protease